MHTRIQLDPTDQVSVRAGKGTAIEIVVTDPRSECSTVIELSPEQLTAIVGELPLR